MANPNTESGSDDEYAMVDADANANAVELTAVLQRVKTIVNGSPAGATPEPVKAPVSDNAAVAAPAPVVEPVVEPVQPVNVPVVASVYPVLGKCERKYHLSALLDAINNGDVIMIKSIVASGDIPRDELSIAFLDAVRKNRAEIAQYLGDNGACVSVNFDEALSISAEKGCLPLIQYLLDKGIDIHTRNDVALRTASYNGHLAVVKCLVERGADIHADSDYALRWASEYGHFDVVKHLIKAGGNVRADDDDALRSAARKNHLSIVKLLVENGANIHARNDGPLEAARRYNHHDIVQYLNDCAKKEVSPIQLQAQLDEMRKEIAELKSQLKVHRPYVPYQSKYAWVGGCFLNLDNIDNMGTRKVHNELILEVVSNGYKETIGDTAAKAKSCKEELCELMIKREKFLESVRPQA